MSRNPDAPPVNGRLTPETAEQVRAQLERVLNSKQFRNSRRCQILLRKVTEQTLAGDTTGLKERTLGVDVFGRPPHYDSNQDPIVRATAAETRKKLAQYYQDPEHESELRIELLPGCYVPEFHPGPPPSTPAPATPPKPLPWKRIAAAAAVVVTIAVAALLLFRHTPTLVERFWNPVLQAPGTLLVCLGQPVAYNLMSAEAQDRMQAKQKGTNPPSPGDQSGSIPMNQLVILWDRYIALGDAVCLVRLTSLFEKHNRAYRIRGEGSTSFSDLRENPTVFIGAFDNPWTLRAAGQLRFTFFKDSAHETDMVRDRNHPEKTDWKLTGAWPYWKIPNDYAIVSRVLDATTDRPAVIAAGITQYGTSAAGEFLTNPEYLAEAIAQLPPNWERKNLQIVLRVPVVEGASGRPRVLATHVW